MMLPLKSTLLRQSVLDSHLKDDMHFSPDFPSLRLVL
jgi:hypothetical protein